MCIVFRFHNDGLLGEAIPSGIFLANAQHGRAISMCTSALFALVEKAHACDVFQPPFMSDGASVSCRPRALRAA